jgi:hypothetical protein
MPGQISDRWPGPGRGLWDAADASLASWLSELNANADAIAGNVKRYTAWATSAVDSIERSAAGLSVGQRERIQSGVAAIPFKSWHHALDRAQGSLAFYPPLKHLVASDGIYRRITVPFGTGVRGTVIGAVAQGVPREGQQDVVELLTRPWRSAGLPLPVPPLQLCV